MTRWVGKLLEWFSIHQREMPWRDDPSPYKVWISEIMLQQTRVTAVIPYFENFMHRFPDVDQLAHALLQDVLKAWEGLGYYSRARNLHRAAKCIVFDRNGVFPDTETEWLTIPGVGPYTAAAITSIAFGKPAAAIDGNVMRVWSRLRGIKEDISSNAWKTKARTDLLRYTKQSNPSHFNQAMMELGALVCLPKNPACADCPLSSRCIAFRTDQTAYIPLRKIKKKVPHKEEVVLLIYHNNEILMRQRPTDGLLGGLWEFPSVPSAGSGNRKRKVMQLCSSLASLHSEIEKRYDIQHAFTHFTQTLYVYAVLVDQKILDLGEEYSWQLIKHLDDLPLSRTQRQIADKPEFRTSRKHLIKPL
jgi:A/G-specific adenine glycosylase